MKKFISKIFVFIIFSGLFYIIFLFFWGSCMPSIFKPNINYTIGSYGHLYSRLDEVKNKKNIDILFLGSSHAYRGFDTRIFSEYNFESFNLGSSNQTPIQTKILLNRYLDQLNPKVVVYEVYPHSFMVDGVESSVDIIANDKNDLLSLKMAFKINNIKTYNTFIYGFIRDCLGLNKKFTESTKKGRDTYVSGGFVEKKIGYFKPREFEKKTIDLKQVQLESFSEIISELKKKNIKIILIYAPIPRANYNSYSNNIYFDKLMSDYAEYYNFNEIMKLNDSLHFYDADHLNKNGVSLFNKKLIEVLKNKE
jgi:hypothetical protein